jgi:hypothetical protein
VSDDRSRRVIYVTDPLTGEQVPAYPVVGRQKVGWRAQDVTSAAAVSAEMWSLLDEMETGVEDFVAADQLARDAVDAYERAWQADYMRIIRLGGYPDSNGQLVKVTATAAEKVAKALHLDLQSEARIAERNAQRAKHVGQVRDGQKGLVQSLAKDHRSAIGGQP